MINQNYIILESAKRLTKAGTYEIKRMMPSQKTIGGRNRLLSQLINSFLIRIYKIEETQNC